MKKQLNIRIRSNSGFNLIEILVTMLIMAVGLMGIAALQFKGLQYNTDAYTRSQINFLVYDIADRVRLNRDNAASYISTYQAGNSHTACVHATGANAANDLNCWYDLVDAYLPFGSDAIITQPSTGQYQVQLAWTDRGNSSHTLNFSFQP